MIIIIIIIIISSSSSSSSSGGGIFFIIIQPWGDIYISKKVHFKYMIYKGGKWMFWCHFMTDLTV